MKLEDLENKTKKYSEITIEDFKDVTPTLRADLITKRNSLNDNGEFVCVAMVAEEIDAHGDWFTRECVKKAYEDYIDNYNHSHGVQHQGNEIDAKLLSHWYTEEGGIFDGVEAPKYSFIAKFLINDEEIRKQCKQGNLTGISIEAQATTVDYNKLEEKGYTINDISTLTKSAKVSKFTKPKRVILKANVNKIDFVDMGANLRTGLYKAEKFQTEEIYDIVNDILEEELTPSINYSLAKNIKLKEKRSKIYGIKANVYKPFYYDGIESYELEYYLDPVNLMMEVKTNEQMSSLLSRHKYVQWDYDPEDYAVINNRLVKILLEHDYDISYDYIKSHLKDFDKELLKQIKDKYEPAQEESVISMENKELVDLIRTTINEVLTTKSAEQAEFEKQQKLVKEQEAKELERVQLEKQEKEKQEAKIAELEAKIAELAKSKEGSTPADKNEKVEDQAESVEQKIAKAVDEKVKETIARIAPNVNTEVKKSEKHGENPAGAFAGFFSNN